MPIQTSTAPMTPATEYVFAPIFNLFPTYYTPLADLGRFSVELAKGRWPDQVMFRNAEMRKLVKTLPPLGA